MMINKKFLLIPILIIFVVFASGCFDFAFHDEADKIEVDYLSKGYYYFEDDNGRSFNQTLWEDDISTFVKGKNPSQWIDYVRSLNYIEDENDKEIFYSCNETIARGGGDCEDLAILMSRGLHEMGFDTCVIVQESHVLTGINAKQVYNNYKGIRMINTKSTTFKNVKVDGYYALETTAKWGIGEFDERIIKYEKIYVL